MRNAKKVLVGFAAGLGVAVLPALAAAQTAQKSATPPPPPAAPTPAAPPPAAAPPASVPAHAPAPSATAAFPNPPVPPAAAPPPAAPPPSAAAPPAPRRATVRFNADEEGALLEADTTADGRSVSWFMVCEAPCNSTVSTNGSFRVSGYGYHPSREFRLPEGKSEASVDAEMESSSIAVPMAITIVGGVAMSVGGWVFLMGLSAEQQHRDGDDLIQAGAIVGGIGVGIASIGAVILVVNSQNKESRARVTRRELELPGGMALGSRGVTF